MRIARMVKRWFVRKRATIIIRSALWKVPLQLHVRWAYRRRTGAIRIMQCAWRHFTRRVGLLVEALLNGPWRRLEFYLLEQIFTACPLDEDIIVGDPHLLCNDYGDNGDTTLSQGGSRPQARRNTDKMPWRNPGQRPGLIPHASTLPCTANKRASSASGSLEPPQRPASRQRTRNVFPTEKQCQDEELKKLIAQSFKRHVRCATTTPSTNGFDVFLCRNFVIFYFLHFYIPF